MNTKSSESGLRYPLVSLPACIKIAEAVRDAGGANADVPRSVLAHALNTDEKAASFHQRIGSAKTFGLIDGRAIYRLTEHAKKYFYPVTLHEKTLAELAFVNSPPVFAALIQRFDSSRVEEKHVANILHRELGIPASWKDRVAGMFMRSAEFVGALDTQGFLRFKSKLHTAESGPQLAAPQRPAFDQANQSKIPATPNPEAPVRPVFASEEMNCWTFSVDRQTVRLETPREISMQLWTKLEKYVQVIKPEVKND